MPDATTTSGGATGAGASVKGPKSHPVFIFTGPDGKEYEVQSDKQSIYHYRSLCQRDAKHWRPKEAKPLWDMGYLPRKVYEGAVPSSTETVPTTGNVYHVAPMNPAVPGRCRGDPERMLEDLEYFREQVGIGNFSEVPMAEVTTKDSDGNPVLRHLPAEAVSVEMLANQDIGNALAARAGNAPRSADIPGLIEGMAADSALARPKSKVEEVKDRLRKAREQRKEAST